MVINALIIVFLLWFLYQRFASVKGIQQIATTELKANLKNKNHVFNKDSDYKLNLYKKTLKINKEKFEMKVNKSESISEKTFVFLESKKKIIEYTLVKSFLSIFYN